MNELCLGKLPTGDENIQLNNNTGREKQRMTSENKLFFFQGTLAPRFPPFSRLFFITPDTSVFLRSFAAQLWCIMYGVWLKTVSYGKMGLRWRGRDCLLLSLRACGIAVMRHSACRSTTLSCFHLNEEHQRSLCPQRSPNLQQGDRLLSTAVSHFVWMLSLLEEINLTVNNFTFSVLLDVCYGKSFLRTAENLCWQTSLMSRYHPEDRTGTKESSCSKLESINQYSRGQTSQRETRIHNLCILYPFC